MGIRKDILDYQMAINRGWKITDEMKNRIMQECMLVIETSQNAREKIRAVECLTSMESQNIQIDNASKAKVHLNLNATNGQISSDENNTIIDSIVSGHISEHKEITAEEFIESCKQEDPSEESDEPPK
tara:strand:- start:66 stop:449 length:384 start_codon:yes stop_codon:yes gene_type:complete